MIPVLKPWSTVVLGLVVWFGSATPAPTQTEQLDRILAVVVGQLVMQSDVRAFVELQLVDIDVGSDDPEAVVLNRLIERRLILEEVDRYVVADPPAATVERRLGEVRAKFSTAEAFETTLARVGFSLDDLRQVLNDNARRDAYLTDRFAAASAPTAAQLRQFYEEHADEFTTASRQLSYDEARPVVQQRVAMELRAEMISEWVADLVRRGDVSRVPER